jgi:hypothetical protein
MPLTIDHDSIWGATTDNAPAVVLAAHGLGVHAALDFLVLDVDGGLRVVAEGAAPGANFLTLTPGLHHVAVALAVGEKLEATPPAGSTVCWRCSSAVTT